MRIINPEVELVFANRCRVRKNQRHLITVDSLSKAITSAIGGGYTRQRCYGQNYGECQ